MIVIISVTILSFALYESYFIEDKNSRTTAVNIIQKVYRKEEINRFQADLLL